MEKIKKDAIQQKGKKINLIFPEHLQPFYSNFANFHLTLTELKIDFTFKTDSENAVVGSQIVMSPQHAKIFVNVLSGLLVKYEKDLGKIPSDK
jgi:hypothetical protein